MSAWNCISRSFTAAPPSTRRAVQRRAGLAIDGFEHVGYLEGDGFERRARNVAGAVSRRRPINMPAACASQCGAPRPTKAGTKTTPSVSGTLAASASTSAEEPMSFKLSRSHCTTAPAMKMLPSSAYSRRSAALAATVVMSLPATA